MNILHTSDWHLGARLGNQDRLPDQFARLEEICSAIDENEVDLLIVAGDIFDEHRAEPLAKIVVRLARLLKPRAAAGLTTVFIAGNHDREHVFPLLTGLQDLVAPEGERRVVFASRPTLETITTRLGKRLQLLLLPYPTPSAYSLAAESWPSPDTKRAALAEALRGTLNELSTNARVSKNVQTVLVGHFLLRGAAGNGYELTEQEDVIIEAGDLPVYSYAALGHVHKPQYVGAPYIRYCGSIERMDRGEAGDTKEALLVKMGESGLEDVVPIPLSATPLELVEAASESELEDAAAGMKEKEHALVSVRLTLNREMSLASMQDLARRLFPRMYKAPEITWLDAPERAPVRSIERLDPRSTVRRYIQKAVPEEDAARDALLHIADNVMDAVGVDKIG